MSLNDELSIRLYDKANVSKGKWKYPVFDSFSLPSVQTTHFSFLFLGVLSTTRVFVVVVVIFLSFPHGPRVLFLFLSRFALRNSAWARRRPFSLPPCCLRSLSSHYRVSIIHPMLKSFLTTSQVKSSPVFTIPHAATWCCSSSRHPISNPGPEWSVLQTII